MVLQSSFGVTSFVNEVVFLKMPSRQEKEREKRRAKYLHVRDDVLESARAGLPKAGRPFRPTIQAGPSGLTFRPEPGLKGHLLKI